ncbi:MAG: hypothetical protein GC137_01425 [Alphaproteobacteria bacterium]|nr:hypothetical protein [Alphaproteobacteria bacterium]
MIRVFFLVMAVLCCASISQAQARSCPRHQVEAQLESKLVKTRMFRGTASEFTEYVTGHDREDSRILGFVNQSEIYTTLDYYFSTVDMGDGTYCVMLDAVRGFFYAAPKLYLPSDYPRGSCEYEEILKHEQRHLDTVYEFHARNTGKYATYLGKIARRVPVLEPVRTEDELENQRETIQYYFEDRFRTLEEQSIIELNAQQRKIDSPEEYRGVLRRCGNW